MRHCFDDTEVRTRFADFAFYGQGDQIMPLWECGLPGTW